MERRGVTHTGKDRDGDILSLCNPSAPWSPRRKEEAIRDIEGRTCEYYVPWRDGRETEVHVVDGPTGRYLRTDRDDTPRNNLDDLPNCPPSAPDRPGPATPPRPPGHRPVG